MPLRRNSPVRQRLKHNIGIRADRLAIRQHIPVYVYLLAISGSILLGIVSTLGYQAMNGKRSCESQIESLGAELAASRIEIDRLKSDLSTAPNELLMAQATQQSLSAKLAAAEEELLKVKEEMAICDRGSKRAPGVRTAPIEIPGGGTIPANTRTK